VRTTFGARLEWNLKTSMHNHGRLATNVQAPLTTFRIGIDGDAWYPSYVTSSTASKYNGNVGLTTGPSLQSSQEVS
jgi:hypothetical protein